MEVEQPKADAFVKFVKDYLSYFTQEQMAFLIPLKEHGLNFHNIYGRCVGVVCRFLDDRKRTDLTPANIGRLRADLKRYISLCSQMIYEMGGLNNTVLRHQEHHTSAGDVAVLPSRWENYSLEELRTVPDPSVALVRGAISTVDIGVLPSAPGELETSLVVSSSSSASSERASTRT